MQTKRTIKPQDMKNFRASFVKSCIEGNLEEVKTQLQTHSQFFSNHIFSNYIISNNLITTAMLMLVSCHRPPFTENHLKIAELLINEGADLGATPSNMSTALCGAAAIYGTTQFADALLKLLLAKKPNVNKANSFFPQLTPLHIACRAGSLDAVKLLIEHGANVNKKNNENRTPFSVACLFGRLDIVKFLLKETKVNVDFNIMTEIKMLPFELVKNGDNYPQILELLSQHQQIQKTNTPSDEKKDSRISSLNQRMNAAKSQMGSLVTEVESKTTTQTQAVIQLDRISTQLESIRTEINSIAEEVNPTGKYQNESKQVTSTQEKRRAKRIQIREAQQKQKQENLEREKREALESQALAAQAKAERESKEKAEQEKQQTDINLMLDKITSIIPDKEEIDHALLIILGDHDHKVKKQWESKTNSRSELNKISAAIDDFHSLKAALTNSKPDDASLKQARLLLEIFQDPKTNNLITKLREDKISVNNFVENRKTKKTKLNTVEINLAMKKQEKELKKQAEEKEKIRANEERAQRKTEHEKAKREKAQAKAEREEAKRRTEQKEIKSEAKKQSSPLQSCQPLLRTCRGKLQPTSSHDRSPLWMPAFAGMTEKLGLFASQLQPKRIDYGAAFRSPIAERNVFFTDIQPTMPRKS